MQLILASTSKTRAALLAAAHIAFDTVPPRVDEQAILQALIAEEAKPHDIADALAEMKARKVADKYPTALVIGCDRVLE